jgi:hypothetical protein
MQVMVKNQVKISDQKMNKWTWKMEMNYEKERENEL